MALRVVSDPGFVNGYPICATPEQRLAEELETKPLLNSGRDDGVSYWVLVLSATGSRLYTGLREALTPVVGQVFPMQWSGPHLAHAAGQGDLACDAAHLQFIQAVDRRVGEFLTTDSWPLVLVGNSRSLASFCSLTRQRDRIIGCVRGEHGRTSATELARLVWPLVFSALVRGRVRIRTAVWAPRPERWLMVQSSEPV